MSLPAPADQLRYFQKRQNKIVETIRQLVELESPSDVKQSVDRVGTGRPGAAVGSDDLDPGTHCG